MSRQSKTKRRLFILLGGALALGTLAGGGALYRWHYINQRAQQGRTDGLAAMARGDYPTALVQLGKYLSRNPNDAAVLLPYAKARRLVEEPNGRHLGQAIALFQRVLELSPALLEAQNNLLELYFQVGYNTEAISLANAILTQSPSDTSTLRLKILTLLRMQRLEEAQTNAQHLTAMDPLNLEFHILEIQIMVSRGNQNQVQDYAKRLAQAHPDDVRFVLLQGIAASVIGDAKSAAALVRPLVARPQADAVYTRVLVRQLDSLELFGEAFTVLQEAAKGTPDHEITQLWIRRLFETNRLPLLIDQTATLDPAAAQSDVEVLAMRALALVRLERLPEALQILAVLDTRSHAEPAAAHWASALHVMTQKDASGPIKTIEALRAALSGNSGNPILLEELGDAYADAGARDKATAAWRDVARMAPAWSAPLVRLSHALAAGGRGADALAAARAAQVRAPEDHDALLGLAAAYAANLPEGPSADATKVLAQLEEIQQKFPKDFGILSLQAGVLAQSRQRDKALDAVRSLVNANPPAPERTLLSLAAMSEAFKLDLEEACFAACQKAHGVTSDFAFARARWLLNHQKAPEGLAFLDQAQAAHADDIRWRSTWASYLDMAGDPRAKNQWMALGDGNPKNVSIQWAAMAANSVQSDHAFVGRTIDRLSAMLGEDSLTLRLVKARWLLQGQPSEADATQASIILSDISRNAPDMAAPRLLLVTCYMRLGNPSGAMDQLAAVSDMQSEQAGIALELARLLQSRGDFTRARQYLDRATKSKLATLQDMRQAASLLALQGDFTTALNLLEKAYASAGPQPPDLVLAALYRQLNQPAKTEEICRKLLEKPDAATISFCADFYASLGRVDDAQHVLTLLDSQKLVPGARELIQANFAAKYVSPEQALKQYQAAAQAAPAEPVIWQQLVAFCLSTGKIDEALAAADQASQKLPSAPPFETLRQNATLVKDSARIPGTRQLLMMLTGAPADDAPALDALRIVASAQQQKEPARQTAVKLRQLADRNPRLLPLQTITLQYYMDAGQTDEAVSMATRAVQSFPAAVEPLRVATTVLGASQHWDQALETAKEWRRLGTGETMDADLAIAAAELHLGNTSAASQQIQPYLDRALLDPEKFSGVILLRAQGLLARHQPDQVETLLGPLLPKSAPWRKLWLTLAVRGVEDAGRAQAWLELVTPYMNDNLGERTALAQAWMSVGRRWSKPEFDAKGRKSLEAIVQLPDAPVSAFLAWGTLCETSSDWTGAEHAYRRALEREPATAIALNNLAYVLVKSKGNLDEARQLITKALGFFPNEPAFLDTRATVQAALKDYPGAVASLKDAQRLDPQNLEWHVNLLSILVDAGQMPAARTELQQITTSLAATPNIAPDLRQRLESLRAKLP